MTARRLVDWAGRGNSHAIGRRTADRMLQLVRAPTPPVAERDATPSRDHRQSMPSADRSSAPTGTDCRSAAESASRAKSQCPASMSHEPSTPLDSILGFANVLRKHRAENLLPQDLGGRSARCIACIALAERQSRATRDERA